MKMYSLFLLFISSFASAEVKQCDNVLIKEVLTGPQYKSMFKIDGKSCIGVDYVCMHPKEGYMDIDVARSVQSNVLAAFASGKRVQVRIESDQISCGGFPMVWLVRAIK